MRYMRFLELRPLSFQRLDFVDSAGVAKGVANEIKTRTRRKDVR
jgi:hypothetical protein